MTTPRPDALTDGGLVRVFDAMHSKTHKPDCDCGLRSLFIEGIEERERAARASLADEVREAERKRSDAERELAALREALVCIARPLGSGAYHGDPKDWRALSVWMVGIARAALAKEEGSCARAALGAMAPRGEG